MQFAVKIIIKLRIGNYSAFSIKHNKVTAIGCIWKKRWRHGCRHESTWMYSRRFLEDMPGNCGGPECVE